MADIDMSVLSYAASPTKFIFHIVNWNSLQGRLIRDAPTKLIL